MNPNRNFLPALAACILFAVLAVLLSSKPARAQVVLSYTAHPTAAQPTPQPHLLARPAFTPFRPWLYGRIWVTPPRYYAVPLAPVAPVCPHCQSR